MAGWMDGWLLVLLVLAAGDGCCGLLDGLLLMVMLSDGC